MDWFSTADLARTRHHWVRWFLVPCFFHFEVDFKSYNSIYIPPLSLKIKDLSTFLCRLLGHGYPYSDKLVSGRPNKLDRFCRLPFHNIILDDFELENQKNLQTIITFFQKLRAHFKNYVSSNRFVKVTFIRCIADFDKGCLWIQCLSISYENKISFEIKKESSMK
jgi:hypothetical protein